jgi:hypothetical protein
MHACPPNIDIGNIRKEHGKTWETNLLTGEWKTASTSKLCMSRTTHPEKGESCIASSASDSSDPPATADTALQTVSSLCSDHGKELKDDA